jgi:nicotinamidase-related amidase
LPTSSNLHGDEVQESPVALLLIDVVNDLEWPGGEAVLGPALAMAERIATLKARAYAAKVPVIYANDNFGRWQSDFNAQVEHCLRDGVRGQPLAERLRPTERDYFVLKPKHSGFYSTTLDLLLQHLRCRILVLCGIAGNNCVLFTANDAYMRDYRLVIPSDCVVSNSDEENRWALRQMATILKADVRPSTELELPPA